MKISKKEIVDSLNPLNNKFFNIGSLEHYADKVITFGEAEVLRDKNDMLLGYILYYNNRPDIYITMVWVNEQYRGKGIAKRLLNNIINNNKKNILLEVHKDNPAKYLYYKVGFKEIGLIDENLQMKLTNN